ncbi:tetratricopeptide repeat protein [Myxococcus sp. Y35]|uniref:tetratricopeptide repeat protein n=1 Tax=Pseudomyxococcus flavus TaxID=3115648 RepID=UPI003CF6834E
MGCPDENTLLAYCERALGGAEAQAVEAHLDGCSACLALVGEAARGDEPTVMAEDLASRPRTGEPSLSEEALGRGAVLGRYVVIDRVGAGGMGVVLSAYDPQLDRKVALKLVRSLQGEGARELEARLLREAQAVARLSHPHVITVFDVGTVAGRLFMAMEFVEGCTLRQWLKVRPRSWREVLAVFRQAGEGLAAAHAAQLVHRDFKPDNVLVDGFGRVRVTDFGLARLQDVPASVPTPVPGGVALAQGHGSLTRTGSLVGTPAYIPPEQWNGEPMDARGDQFSFCVALYEALFQVRPFARGQPPDFQRLQEPERDTGVPSWVRRVVLRGLSVSPADRYPSMDALLDALRRDPARKRARAAAGLGAVAVAAGLALVAFLRAEPAPCTGAPGRVAPVWSAARQAKLRQALLATGSPLAASAADTVAGHLSAYVREWEAGYTDACQATHVRHEQSGQVLSLRMACLDSRLQSLDVLADTLEHADAALVVKAAEAALKLPRVADCARVASILSVVPPPDAPDVQARLEDARRRLARARVLLETGRYAQGLTEALAARDEARAVGYRPLEAEALHVTGWLELRLARHEDAARSWAGAERAALAGRDDLLALRAATDRVYIHGYELEDLERGLDQAAAARALMERVGPAEEVAAQLENHLGVVHFGEGLLPQALEHYQRALDIRERVLGPEHLETGKVLSNLALVYVRQGRVRDALPLYERTLDIQRRQLGAEHPLVVNTLLLIGDAHRMLEGPQAALPLYEQALALRRRTLGDTHVSTFQLYSDVGLLHELMGRFDRARDYHEQALALSARALGEEHAAHADALAALARMEVRQGNLERALARYERVLALQERLLGPSAGPTLRAREERAAVLRRVGRAREAVRELEWVLARNEETGGAGQPRLVSGLTELARAWLDLKQPRRARRAAEQALDIIRPLGWSAPRMAEVQFELARALWEVGSREQALSLSGEALTAFQGAGETKASQAREVSRWRDARAGR